MCSKVAREKVARGQRKERSRRAQQQVDAPDQDALHLRFLFFAQRKIMMTSLASFPSRFLNEIFLAIFAFCSSGSLPPSVERNIPPFSSPNPILYKNHIAAVVKPFDQL